uniref:Uncharacterized protein n=1 Tax=Alexandrium monilatum TaxID=311494 RepID=A0A7S4UR73_9DINO
MTAESLPSYNPTREHLPLMSVGRGFQEDEHEDKETSHPTSPSSEDENNSKDCLSFDKTDEKHHLRFKRFRRVRSLYASKESLPTIMSESCEDSEVGSLPPGSRSASRMNSMPVSRSCTRDSLPEFEPYSGGFKARTTTKDSLPPIGDVMETETEEETTDEDNTSAAPDGTAADPKPDDANLNANDVRSALRQAYTQIVTLKAEMAELRRNNADLKHENKVLRTLAAQADVLNNLSGVANKPKDRSNHKDKGRVTISTATIVEVPQTEPPEEVAGPVEDTPTALLATARERWSQRRQERRERRSSNTDGKMSYRRWLQDQHEQVLDLDSRRTSTSTEDGASCPGVTGPPLPEAPEGHPASSAPPRCGAALPG